MKIALVLPPFLYKRCPLIGLAYLSAYLKRKEFEVVIFDLNAEMEIPHEGEERIWEDEFFVEKFLNERYSIFDSQAEKILNSGAEIIGFSMWATTKYTSLTLARMIKQKDKNRLIILGGPECSFDGGSFIKDEAVDIVVRGEGEETILAIAQIYKGHRDVDFCPGALLKINGEVIDCGYRTEIENLDSLPFPDFSGFLLERYYLAHTLPIMFNRGCLGYCVFCNTSVIWKRYRFRSAENIYKEIVYQIKNYPHIRRFEIDDTALNLNPKELSKLSDLINVSGLKIEWGGSAIIHPLMDYNLLKNMAQAGCSFLAYGLESGSQKVIDTMRKGFRIEDAQRVIRDTHGAGIKVLLNIVIGFPNETEQDFVQTMNFIERNRKYINLIAFPSECYIGNNSYLHTHPAEFSVDLSKRQGWESKDGLNTHEERQRRINIFNDFVYSLGISLQISKIFEEKQ
jgi:anaerobic magnesium-protoporphyrin IX monomethyl ester cyclase